MDSVKSQVKNKKGKHWMYFSKHGKKSIQDPSASTKPSGTDGTALPHQPGDHPRKAHLKKRKRKRKPRKPLGSSIIKAEKDRQKVSNESSSTFTFNKEVATKTASERTDDCAGQDHAATGASNTSKAKQLRKKMKRKLKILKRKEMKKTMTGSTEISSNEQDKLDTVSTTKKSKRTSEQTKSNKTSGAISDKELDRETSKEDKSNITSKAVSRKRIRKGELDTTETKKKKKKKQAMIDTVDSGMSSGNDEMPQLPEEPQDVASNWKALATTLKASAPRNPKPKTKNSNARDKAVEKKENEIWFDDVDPALLEAEKGSSEHNASDIAGAGAYQGDNKITKCVALDCEMVGIGHEGKESILARVSMVNEYGHCIYDKFVKPREKVTDFRTEFSGVRPKDLFKGNAEEFLTVQKEIADIMKDRILVGHALKNDMKVLFLGQPRKLIRDTASYPHFRELMKTKRPSLKKLAKTVLGVTVQEGEHNSVEDAQTAMRLYTLHRTAWEKSLKQRGKTIKK
ncbi:RNA exonuclease 4 [Strongylocentrotus purpuratus]|uniref:RNA exonuclease 4 n=1 Tax=Strongylocentrotus purpuratus TaxID=7668 RepID=A0A7M7REA8_STRPU|nr:RNA exonuclease 4 [Strongylocentrotus purpuratus]